MANQNYLHTAEIMKASLPYFDARNQIRVEFISKLFDLMGSLHVLTRPDSMVACGYDNASIDVEGLLNGIRPLCNDREKDMVDRILNIFNAKRILEMYNNLMSTMKTMQEFGGFPFEASESNDDTDTVTGNSADSNFDSVPHNTDKDSADKDPELHKAEEENSPDNKQASAEDKNGASTPNNAMFEMLKGMIPPEQMSTFENLRMLLNTMSYDDNNSKPNVSKEQNDG